MGSQPTAPIFHGIANFNYKVGLNKHIYSSAHTTVTRYVHRAGIDCISTRTTVYRYLLINIGFTVWITLKHENNTIHQHPSQHLEASGLLYDEDIKVMIVTGRLDFHVKMGLALFYQLKKSIDLKRVMFFLQADEYYCPDKIRVLQM
jgi:hypothetical protein